MESEQQSMAEVKEPLVGQIETDRFCDECGFNMRTLPVWRDSRTRLLLAKCTECGRIHHAAALTLAVRTWQSRIGVLFVVLWMALIVAATFLLGTIETALPMVTLDELTEWSPAGRILKVDFREYPEFMSAVLGGSAAAGFIMVTLYACAAHHWKRVYLVLFAVVLPLIPMTIAWRGWLHEAPHLELWGWRYILSHTSAQVAGGILAAFFARPVMRLLASAMLPPRSRAALSFLWIADGKPPPGGRKGNGLT